MKLIIGVDQYFFQVLRISFFLFLTYDIDSNLLYCRCDPYGVREQIETDRGSHMVSHDLVRFVDYSTSCLFCSPYIAPPQEQSPFSVFILRQKHKLQASCLNQCYGA